MIGKVCSTNSTPYFRYTAFRRIYIRENENIQTDIPNNLHDYSNPNIRKFESYLRF